MNFACLLVCKTYNPPEPSGPQYASVITTMKALPPSYIIIIYYNIIMCRLSSSIYAFYVNIYLLFCNHSNCIIIFYDIILCNNLCILFKKFGKVIILPYNETLWSLNSDFRIFIMMKYIIWVYSTEFSLFYASYFAY